MSKRAAAAAYRILMSTDDYNFRRLAAALNGKYHRWLRKRRMIEIFDGDIRTTYRKSGPFIFDPSC